jgi:hypothetical protein
MDQEAIGLPLFGAVFNLLSNVKLTLLLDYALQAFVGGLICLAFKILGDILSPLWVVGRINSFSTLDQLSLS